jgi:hypothetical protein
MRILTLLLFCALFVMSCSESDVIKEVHSPIHQYVVFKPGSYWVYDVHILMDDGVKKSWGKDSVYIEKDTLINAKRFWITKGTRFLTRFKSVARDSGNFYMSSDREILLSIDPHHVREADFSIGTTHYGTFKYALAPSEMINTSAGIFGAIRYHGKFYMGESRYENLDANTYYATGVGLVKQQNALFGHENKVFRELIRYKIVK